MTGIEPNRVASDGFELFGEWLSEQGWCTSREFHPLGGLHLRVTNGRSVIWLYRPKDQSLVIRTTYSLSERQLVRLLELDRAGYLNLTWSIKVGALSAGLVIELLPHGAELTDVTATIQLWEPAITKHNVLTSSLRMLQFQEFFHAILESHLSSIASWEVESLRALVPPPGDKPVLRVVP